MVSHAVNPGSWLYGSSRWTLSDGQGNNAVHPQDWIANLKNELRSGTISIVQYKAVLAGADISELQAEEIYTEFQEVCFVPKPLACPDIDAY